MCVSLRIDVNIRNIQGATPLHLTQSPDVIEVKLHRHVHTHTHMNAHTYNSTYLTHRQTDIPVYSYIGRFKEGERGQFPYVSFALFYTRKIAIDTS